MEKTAFTPCGPRVAAPVSGAPGPIEVREPDLDDGAAMWEIAERSDALETNTPYSYLMLAGLTPETCVLAVRNGTPVGFVSALIPPRRRDTIFVWQVAVDRAARSTGLGKTMLVDLLNRPICRQVRFLEATVTPDNGASTALFESVARDFDAPCLVTTGIPEDLFPEPGHEEERLFRIGPLNRTPLDGEKSEYLRTT